MEGDFNLKKPLVVGLGLVAIFVIAGLMARTKATDGSASSDLSKETLSDLASYNRAKELAINTCSPIIAWVVGQKSGLQQHSGKITKILSSEYNYWNMYGDGDDYEWQRFEFIVEMKVESKWEHTPVTSKIYQVAVGQACQVEEIVDPAGKNKAAVAPVKTDDKSETSK